MPGKTFQLPRCVVTAAIASLIALGSIGSAAAIYMQHLSQTYSIHEAGHVLTINTTPYAEVVDRDGHQLMRMCSDGTAFSGKLFPSDNVVVWSDAPIIIAGRYYYQVAYPDPCEPGGDFSSTSDLRQGKGALGYVATSDLLETSTVTPVTSANSGKGADWRDCWGPTTRECSDEYAKNRKIQLSSADGNVLYAFWDGQSWEPRWWHVLGSALLGSHSKEVAVYGRDWTAQVSVNAPVPVPSPYPSPTPTSDPSLAHLVSVTPQLSGMLGSTVTITLILTNVGSPTWSTQNGYQFVGVYCGAESCGDLSQPFFQSLNGISVPQGVTQRFSLITPLRADGLNISSTSAIVVKWSLYHNGEPVPYDNAEAVSNYECGLQGELCSTIQIISGTTPSATITPTIPSQPTLTATPQVDAASFIGQSSSPTTNPGQQVSIYFTLQNTGSTSWSDSAGYQLTCTATCLGAGNVDFGGQSVQPGQQHQFNISINAPGSPGVYRTFWILEHNGQPFGPNLNIDITVAGPNWYPILQQPAPTCNNPTGTSWGMPREGATGLTCTGSGLLMQQLTNTHYGEVDLNSVNGTNYDQTTFQVQIQVAFQSPGDTSTSAALIVQTPQSACGGLIFVLSPNGQWQLQNVLGCTTIPVVANGTANINPSQPSAILIRVQNSVLQAFINGQRVLSYNDNLNQSPSETGLMVQMPHNGPSSVVQFSNFELDMWGYGN